ncbi:MAG: hypothetical protein GKS06_19915 [Acidobacteria bacterium]|nr:hypothetical protein [Acidobacteriota bacterium]
MRQRHLRQSVFAALMIVAVLGAFAVHTHELGASDDCYLCACGSCPEPGAVTLAFDQPRSTTWRNTPAQVPPTAPPAADAVTRRGPPVSAA